MSVLQPSDNNRKYIYTLRTESEVNDIYYITSLGGVYSKDNEFDVDGTVCADRNVNGPEIVTGTINSGSTTSAAVGTGLMSLKETQLVALIFPSSMTSTSMTFSASDTESGTYSTVRTVDSGSSYTISVAASTYVPLDPRVFSGVKYVKLIGGSSEAGARSIQMVLHKL